MLTLTSREPGARVRSPAAQFRRPLRANGRSAAVAVDASVVALGADQKLTARQNVVRIRISGTSPVLRQLWPRLQEGAADLAPRIGLLREETLEQGVRSAWFRRHRTDRPRAIGGEAGAVSEGVANCITDVSGICSRGHHQPSSSAHRAHHERIPGELRVRDVYAGPSFSR